MSIVLFVVVVKHLHDLVLRVCHQATAVYSVAVVVFLGSSYLLHVVLVLYLHQLFLLVLLEHCEPDFVYESLLALVELDELCYVYVYALHQHASCMHKLAVYQVT